ncbi:uncharacterized protein LOC126905619 [Daktulosphaira vitifoliae]|uniref:uncharacterized protein LOC126905619 n=1 Tax=Daktulosphaira vitifoliae TaxID=58002 RepID=UPI0021AA35E4|nr:uncharacterized protein LOC126905619 [Daktulosphaira vitifoliae]
MDELNFSEKLVLKEHNARRELAKCLQGFNLLKYVKGTFSSLESKFNERCRGYRAKLEYNILSEVEIDKDMSEYICNMLKKSAMKNIGGMNACLAAVTACSQKYRHYLKEDVPLSTIKVMKIMTNDVIVSTQKKLKGLLKKKSDEESEKLL